MSSLQYAANRAKAEERRPHNFPECRRPEQLSLWQMAYKGDLTKSLKQLSSVPWFFHLQVFIWGETLGIRYGQRRELGLTQSFSSKRFSLCVCMQPGVALFSTPGLEGLRVFQQGRPLPPTPRWLTHSCPFRALAPRAGGLIHLSFRVPTWAHQCATETGHQRSSALKGGWQTNSQ